MNNHTTNNNGRKTNSRPNEFYINALKTQSSKDIEEIYRDHFGPIKTLIMQSGGTEFDARDLFQEGLIIIFSKVQADTLNLKTNFRSYIFGICRNLWLKSLRTSLRNTNLEALSFSQEHYEEIQEFDLLAHRKQLLSTKLNQLAADEQKVLRLFFKGTKMKQIAKLMGYASEGYAKKKKNVVKNKLVALMKADLIFGELAY